jgi:cytochrome P450
VEMKVVLREVLRRVRLRAASQRPERPRTQHVTVVPARGTRVVVEERLAEPTVRERAAIGTTA